MINSNDWCRVICGKDGPEGGSPGVPSILRIPLDRKTSAERNPRWENVEMWILMAEPSSGSHPHGPSSLTPVVRITHANMDPTKTVGFESYKTPCHPILSTPLQSAHSNTRDSDSS